MSRTKRMLEDYLSEDLQKRSDGADLSANIAHRRFNSDTSPLFCPLCGRCMTRKGMPHDVLELVGECACG